MEGENEWLEFWMEWKIALLSKKKKAYADAESIVKYEERKKGITSTPLLIGRGQAIVNNIY